MAEQLTSELEAVNAMLSAVGETRVNTITGSLPAGLQAAVDLLRETSRDVQLTGWQFNTEEEYTLSRDGNDYIYLPQNVLDCDITVENGSVDVVQRGSRLYDRKNHTYEFDENIEATLIWYLPWTQLPESARNYIKIRAARIYQDQTVGSEAHHRYTATDESQAYAKLLSSDTQNQDATIFDNMDVASIVRRRRPQIFQF